MRDIQISREVRTSVTVSIRSHFAVTANRGQGRVPKILLRFSNKANVISPRGGVADSEMCCGLEVTGKM